MQPSSASKPLVLRMLDDRLTYAYEKDDEVSRIAVLAAAAAANPRRRASA